MTVHSNKSAPYPAGDVPDQKMSRKKEEFLCAVGWLKVSMAGHGQLTRDSTSFHM